MMLLLHPAMSLPAEDTILYNKRLIEQEHRYAEALANLQKAAAKNSRSAPLQYWLSIAYFKNDRFPEAAEAMERAFSLKLYKTYLISAYEYLGTSYHRIGHYQRALNTFDNALAIDSKNLGARFGRAEALQKMLRLNEALADYNQVLIQSPHAAGALEGRAWVYFKMEILDRAVADFSAAIEERGAKDLSVLDLYRGRGLAYQKREDCRAAVEDFRQALIIAGGKAPQALAGILQPLGWCRYGLGEFQKALADFQKALSHLGPDQKMIKVDLIRGTAFAHLGLGDATSAFRSIEEARKAAERDNGYDPDFDLALIHYANGNPSTSREHWGNRGFIGLEVMDAKSDAGTGVMVTGLRANGPAERAGIVKGDLIVRLAGVALTDVRSLTAASRMLKPGDSADVVVLRNGAEKKLRLKVASFEEQIAGEKLLAPIVAARVAAGPAPAAGKVSPEAAPPGSTTGADPLTPAIAKQGEKKDIIMINSITVIPEKVTPGELFEVKIDFFAESLQQQQKSLAVALLYTISRNGQVVKRFDPETFDILNGEPTILHKKTRASKASGDYELHFELQFQGQLAQKSVALQIR